MQYRALANAVMHRISFLRDSQHNMIDNQAITF